MNGTNGSKNNKINLDITDQHKSFNEKIDEVRNLVEENLRYSKSLSSREEKVQTDLVSQTELQKMLQENLKISKQLYEMTKKINRWMVWQRTFGVIKILIIVIPIVLGIIYLPSLIGESIKPLQDMYKDILGLNQSADKGQNSIQDIGN